MAYEELSSNLHSCQLSLPLDKIWCKVKLRNQNQLWKNVNLTKMNWSGLKSTMSQSAYRKQIVPSAAEQCPKVMTSTLLIASTSFTDSASRNGLSTHHSALTAEGTAGSPCINQIQSCKKDSYEGTHWIAIASWAPIETENILEPNLLYLILKIKFLFRYSSSKLNLFYLNSHFECLNN